jgi:hypothetical protein
MEVPYRGIERSDPAKRPFVYCISHSRWNDGYASVEYVKHNKRDVIPQGVTWIQIGDQNRLLSTSPYGRPAEPEEWLPWRWMEDSGDAKVRFLWERMRATRRADCSDAGMAYFLLTGDEECDPVKLKQLLDDHVIPTPIEPRTRLRLEAENFRMLEGCEVEYRNDRTASHRISVRLASGGAGQIRTPFDEIYAAPSGRYDVDIRYAGGESDRSEFRLRVNGQSQGAAWETPADGQGWQTQTIPGVVVRLGDEIAVDVRGATGAGLDYVQLTLAMV